VLESDRSEQAAHAQTIERLQARYDQVESRIETMYVDKLEGRIGQEFFDKRAGEWRREQEALLRKMHEVQNAAPAPVDQAIDTLRLTSQACQLFLQQSAGAPRSLLQLLIKDAAWRDGMLRTTLFEPFEILRHSNQESSTKERESRGSGQDLQIWLLR
jgi:site-specific DNA recombinase